MNPFSFDKSYYDKGLNSVAGIDEAGRGPLAGPVVAAAVILPKDIEIQHLNDSKKLTQKKRESLFEIIQKEAIDFSIAVIDNTIVDSVNILQATFLAMKQAVKSLKTKPDLCLIDGNHKVPNIDFEQEAIIDGDAKSAAIAAASIIAKVTRDKIMLDFSIKYPNYSFEKHKGYGTKEHLKALEKFGPCKIHRISFAPVKLCKQKQEILSL